MKIVNDVIERYMKQNDRMAKAVNAGTDFSMDSVPVFLLRMWCSDEREDM